MSITNKNKKNCLFNLMQIIDNINKIVKDDLQTGIYKGSKMPIAASLRQE